MTVKKWLDGLKSLSWMCIQCTSHSPNSSQLIFQFQYIFMLMHGSIKIMTINNDRKRTIKRAPLSLGGGRSWYDFMNKQENKKAGIELLRLFIY